MFNRNVRRVVVVLAVAVCSGVVVLGSGAAQAAGTKQVLSDKIVFAGTGNSSTGVITVTRCHIKSDAEKASACQMAVQASSTTMAVTANSSDGTMTMQLTLTKVSSTTSTAAGSAVEQDVEGGAVQPPYQATVKGTIVRKPKGKTFTINGSLAVFEDSKLP